MTRESQKQNSAHEGTPSENGEPIEKVVSVEPGASIEQPTSEKASRRPRVVKAEKAPRKVKSKSKLKSGTGIPSDPPKEAFSGDTPSKEELDEDEKEFRAMRRDMDGVKDTAAIGIVTINVGKTPPRNEFFRTYAPFHPIIPMVNIEKGMEKHFFAVAPSMIAPLQEIGINVTDHALYLTVTSGGTVTVVPVRQAAGDGEQNEYDRTKEIGLRQARGGWFRLYTDQANRCYKVFPAVEGRFTDPVWPDISAAKIFRLAFRDKGRLIDSVDHPLFQKWASRDREDDGKK